MRILHVTNIASHLQLPLARQFVSLLGENNFRFATTMQPSVERQRMGWNCKEHEKWVLNAGEKVSDLEEFEQWWDQADVVLCGERILSFFQRRLLSNKLMFYMSERWWKPPIGKWRLCHPQYALMAAKFAILARSNQLHYLAISPFAAHDITYLAPFRGRLWQWGYFTGINDKASINRASDVFTVFWAGRMLWWKQVDTLIRAFAKLHDLQPKAQLLLVGDGPERAYLEQLITNLRLQDAVQILDSIPPNQVRQIMQKSHVYVLPSNGYEGWGAVVNEAMSEGCPVIASDVVGSASAIIRNGVNGLTFRSGCANELAVLLLLLSNDETLRMNLALAGYRAIHDLWSPKIAANRFLLLCDALLARRPTPIISVGPLAPAWHEKWNAFGNTVVG